MQLSLSQAVLRIASVACAVFLAGCVSPATKSMHQSEVGEDQAIGTLREVQNTAERPVVVVHEDDQWVDASPVALAAPVAPRRSDCEVGYNPKEPPSPEGFAKLLSGGKCGFRVRYTADALDRIGGKSNGGGAAAPAAGPVPATPYAGASGVMLPAAAGIPATTYALGPNGSVRSVDIPSYSGPAYALFDQWANALGISWKENADGDVVFFYVDTRTYQVDTTADVRTMKASVRSGTTTTSGAGNGSQSTSSDTGGITGDSGTNQNSDTTTITDFRKDFEGVIAKMVTPGGVGRWAYSATTGTLVVTDVPDVLNSVATVVDATNQKANKQVLLNFVLVRYQQFRKDNNGVSWAKLMFQSLNKNYGVSLANSFPGDSAGISGGVSILDTATGKAAQFAGTDLVVQALAQSGRVSVVRRPSIVAINMQPTPLQIGTQTTYLARSDNTLTAGGTATGFSQTSLVPGVVTTGFNMSVMPQVLSDNHTMLLQFSMNLSSLNGITDIVSGTSRIQAPSVDNTILVQKVKIASGQTLVMSGIEQDTNDGKRTGVGTPGFWALGGGDARNDSSDLLLLIAQPILL